MREPNLLQVVVVAAGGAFGALAVRYARKRRGALPGGLERLAPFKGVPPGSGAVATPSDYVEVSTAPGKAEVAGRIRSLADRIEKVWPSVTGVSGPVPPGAMEVMLAQAAAEQTGYGQGWEMTGNVGSYQCSGTTGTSFYDCAPHGDSRPTPSGQVPIQAYFRKYKNGVTPDGVSRDALEAGAWDFVRSVTKSPFPALDEILSGDVLYYARRQFGNHYFEAFNLSPQGFEAYAPWPEKLVADGVPLFPAKGGRQIGVSQPDGTWRPTGTNAIPPGLATPMMVAGRVVFYAAAMARSLPEIAAALGHTKVEARVARGLEQPWKSSFQASSGKAMA